MAFEGRLRVRCVADVIVPAVQRDRKTVFIRDGRFEKYGHDFELDAAFGNRAA